MAAEQVMQAFYTYLVGWTQFLLVILLIVKIIQVLGSIKIALKGGEDTADNTTREPKLGKGGGPGAPPQVQKFQAKMVN